MDRRFSTRLFQMGAAGSLMALLTLGCTPAQATPTSAPSSAPVERYISMAAVEPKGGVTVDSEPFPTAKLPAGGGYALKNPDATGRWEVSTYRWDPGTIVVNQGDRVTLEMLGINGKEHPFTISGYEIKDVVRRGQITLVRFTADRAGVFPITCAAHLPAMQANLVVLPSGGN